MECGIRGWIRQMLSAPSRREQAMSGDTVQRDREQNYIETESHLFRGLRAYDERPCLLSEGGRQAVASAHKIDSSSPLYRVFSDVSVPVRLFEVPPPEQTDRQQHGVPDYLLLVLSVPLSEYESVERATQALDTASEEVRMIRERELIDGDALAHHQDLLLELPLDRTIVEPNTHRADPAASLDSSGNSSSDGGGTIFTDGSASYRELLLCPAWLNPWHWQARRNASDRDTADYPIHDHQNGGQRQ